MLARDTRIVYRLGDFRLDVERSALRDPDGKTLVLRPKTLSLLCHLAERSGRLLTRNDLTDALWPNTTVTDDSLNQCFTELRRAFGERAGTMLRTIPRRGYILTAAARRESADVGSGAEQASDGGRPTLVVEPLTNPDGDPVSLRFAGALTTELLRQVTGREDVRMVSQQERGGQHSYRLRGDVRIVGKAVRATVHLEEPTGGTALFSERVEQSAVEPVTLPDDIVTMLVLALEWQIVRDMLRQARTRRSSELGSYQLCLLGRDLVSRGAPADLPAARSLFEQAAKSDQAAAHSWLAYAIYRITIDGGAGRDASVDRDRALAAARRAVQLEPASPFGLAALALCLTMHRRWEEGVAIARVALRLDQRPSSESRTAYAEVLLASGYPEEGEAVVRRALTLDPNCSPVTRAVLGQCLVLSGRPDEALAELRWCVGRQPHYIPGLRALVVAAVETGHLQEGRAAYSQLVQLQQDLPGEGVTDPGSFARPADRERFRQTFALVATPGGSGPGAVTG